MIQTDPETGFTETYRGIVLPAHCDQLGHMNIQHYVARIGDAAFMLMSFCGLSGPEMDKKRRAWVAVRQELDYLAELHADDAILVRSAIGQAGRTSLTMKHEMINTETGEQCLSAHVVLVNMDLDSRRPVPLDDDIRAAIAPFMLKPAEHGA